ncbi:ABC transporter ATP-binding protein [Micromonospora sp. WMMD718]|uniref:ABC transporter ATP-binding protein n=1 Tax=Micromonospora TaxID=1873 RepID=UPI00064C02F1|nr:MULTISPECIES: ABC transporter ATP-binding protein [unclassified Micromonospora]MDG4752598.1 ABC transporter ATP-binding protein [Micromonospora sp. WMMD718]WFF05866.1 ABC transporter ATP-binding protein [Micromonospora sp. WMMD1076]
MDAIAVRGVRKVFGGTVALDDLDLTVTAGEVHGFLGPNGAGKSTTIRALLGQLRVDAGEAKIFGLDCWSQSVAAHRRLAYVPGDVALWPGLTGGASIDVLGRLHGGADPRRRRELIDRFELDPTKRTRTYSKGNRQKVALIAALATNADLFLFDEPTSGLDPLMEEVFQQCVRELKDNGRTVLLSSHILSEVEVLCDRVSIIRRGAVIRSGTLTDLRSHTLTRVTAVTRRPLPDLDRHDDLVDLVVTTRPDGTHVSFRAGSAALAAAVGYVAAAEPASLTVQPPSLDELFLTNYRSDVPNAVAGSAVR